MLPMSIKEIEAAIEELPPEEVDELAEWIAEYRKLASSKTDKPKKRRLGLLEGKLKVPEDFDTMFAEEIRELFEGPEDE